LTDEQIENLIETIAETELSDEQAEELSRLLSSAPDEVKSEFEEQIDIFSGQFDVYVPLGSTVDVEARRSLLAIAASTSIGSLSSRRRN